MAKSILVLAVALTACTPVDPTDDLPSLQDDAASGYRCPGCNLVLVSLDTLRADRLSLYGHSRPTSPHLDALAAEGVVFDNFIHSGGGTLPSHMSMMTSLNPGVHGLRALQNEAPLGAARVTLAERLAENGYRTAAFVDGGWMRGKFGFGQGFEIYDDEGGRFAAIRPKAEAWLSQQGEEPFFLFVHSYDVHSQQDRLPYDCPGDFPQRYTSAAKIDFDGCLDGRCATQLLKEINAQVEKDGRHPGYAPSLGEAEIDYLKALYDGCVNYADEQVALLVDHLRDLTLLDRTLLVVTSDHGEEFFEHGLGLHAQGGYEVVAHIPLVMRWPGGHLGGQRVPQLAAMIDLMPTILDTLDYPVPEEAQGRSLIPAMLHGRATRTEMNMYSMLRTERWKLLPQHGEMYDLDADPAERVNLWAEDPARRKQLTERVRRLINADRAARKGLAANDATARHTHLDDHEIEELKSLGYL